MVGPLTMAAGCTLWRGQINEGFQKGREPADSTRVIKITEVRSPASKFEPSTGRSSGYEQVRGLTTVRRVSTLSSVIFRHGHPEAALHTQA